MNTAAELGRNPVSTRFSLMSREMSGLTRDGTAEPVSQDQIIRRKRGQGNIDFPCSADHVQDWQPYAVDPYSCYMCDHKYIHTCVGVFTPNSWRKMPCSTLFLSFSLSINALNKTLMLHCARQ